MKASLFTLAAVAGLASAQFPGIPQCAIPCLTSAIAGVGCAITDVGCQCSSTQQIQASAGVCILGGCAGPDLNSAISGGLALCSAYLATATGGGSAAATTTVTSAVVTTTATSSVTQTTVTPATTDIPTPTPTITASPGTNSTTTRTSAPSSTSQVPVGAGVKLAGSVGAVAGVMLALLAL